MDSLPASYLTVVLLAFLSGGTTLIGVALALAIGNNSRMTATGIGFSTGIMILIALCELVPESLKLAGPSATSVSVGLGAVLILSLHVAIPHLHLGREEAKPTAEMRAAYLIAFGLILHDFPEGFAMANAFLASPSLGVMVAMVIALHNIPEEFAMAVPAVAVKNQALLFKAAILSGLAEPAGAILGLLAVHVDSTLNPVFMAFAAGAMVMVSLFELVPMARKFGRAEFFTLGLATSGLVYLVLQWLVSEK